MRRLFTLVVLLALIVGANVVFAGGGKINESDFRDKWPSLMASNAGRDFYFTFPPCYEEAGGNSALVVYVACPVETIVRLEVKGNVYTKRTTPNGIIFFKLSPSEGQPFSKPTQSPAPPEEVYTNGAIHITAGAPIVVYGVTRYQFTSDSFLAIPTSSFGKEYFVASMADMSAMYPGYNLPSETCIVAAYDGTKVFFTVGGTIETKTSGGLKSGQTKAWDLNRGDVLAFATIGYEHDLSGSKVVSTKPVGVISGNQCANIPTDIRACDFITEMELPTNTWGKAYHVWSAHTRQKGCLVKIFAKEPNTKVFRDGVFWKVIQKAGGVEGQGYIYDRNAGGTTDPTVYTSDKPISVTIYNPGQEDDGVTSDPFQCIMYPIEQYQKQVLFCTPGNKQSGLSFGSNYVALVYELDSGNVIPKDLEFAIPQGKNIKYTPVSAQFGSSIGRMFKTAVNGKKYAVKYINLPGDNVYSFRCSKPFACYSYGFNSYDSYGHPTSAALADLTFPDPDDPNPTWDINCDGSEIEGSVTDLPNIDSIRSRLSEIYLDPQESFNFDDIVVSDAATRGELVPGTTVTAKWSLKVTDKSKDAKAVIIFSDRRGNDTTITINYYAPNIAITPDTLNFGALKTGESLSKTFTIKNNATGPATISFLELKDKTNLSFTIVNNPIPFTLGPSESKDIEVKFDAKSEGVFTNGIVFGDTCRKIDRFMRASVGDPQIYADDHDFGARSIGSEAQQSLNVYNRGNADLVITDVSVITPDQGVYTWVSPAKPTAANPWIIPAGEKKDFMVSFKPIDAVTYDAARFVFTSNATKTKPYSELKGIGTKPGLQATGGMFGRLRIDQRRSNPAPGVFYSKFKDNSDAVVEVYTNGSEAITIKQVVASGVGVTSFRYNEADFIGKTLNPGGASIKSPVLFNPIDTASYTLELTFVTDKKDEKGNDITAKAIVTGEGGVAILKTKNLSFGSIKVGTQAAPQNLTLESVDYNWAMDAVVEDLISKTPEEIGKQLFGTKGFQLPNVALPQTLSPGKSIPINNCLFLPNEAGNLEAYLTTVSDAWFEVESKWEGIGLSGTPDFTLATTTTQGCVNSSNLIDITVKNTSTGNDKPQLTLDASTITITGADASQFTIVPFATQTLAADASGTFQIRFTPTSAGVKSATLQVIASGVTKTITVTSTGTEYPVTFKFNQKNFEFSLDGSTGGWKHVKPIVGYLGANISSASVDKLKFVVTYDSKYSTPVVKSNNTPIVIMLGAYTNWTAVATPVTKASNMFEVIVTAPSGSTLTNGSGDMFELEFETFIFDSAASESKSGNLNLSATALVASDDSPNQCAVVSTENSTFSRQDVCVIGFRSIEVGSTLFALKAVNPNPVSSAGTEIGFAVGYDTQTELALFNSVGEKVTTLVNQVLRSGEYSLKLDVSSIPSGNYTLKMVSGHVTKSQNVVIVK